MSAGRLGKGPKTAFGTAENPAKHALASRGEALKTWQMARLKS
jgi:hypothetical protein